jgi:hypothetical protein
LPDCQEGINNRHWVIPVNTEQACRQNIGPVHYDPKKKIKKIWQCQNFSKVAKIIVAN